MLNVNICCPESGSLCHFNRCTKHLFNKPTWELFYPQSAAGLFGKYAVPGIQKLVCWLYVNFTYNTMYKDSGCRCNKLNMIKLNLGNHFYVQSGSDKIFHLFSLPEDETAPNKGWFSNMFPNVTLSFTIH